ncbi:hypothetical protein ACW5R3_02560 [Bizionia sp. KMM 8389]
MLGTSWAQKSMERIIDASTIKTIDVDGDTMFRIKILTKDQKTVSMRLEVEGENNEQVVFESYNRNDTLFIGSAYQPLFVKPDDKLAAHKKISIELTLEIPQDLNVNIQSDIATVYAVGSYKYVVAELLNGHFIAENFNGNLQVDTLQGNIIIGVRAAEMELHSKRGLVKQADIPLGANQIQLNSIYGNITVRKTQ